MDCNCSLATLANPLALMRVMWDFAVICWRHLEVFCVRLTRSERAPTIENVVAFENDPTGGGAAGMRRDYSMQVQQGSLSSSMQDSSIGERSPGIDAFSASETPSQTPGPSSGEPEKATRDPQTDQHSLLHGRERPKSLVFTFEGTSSQVSDPADKSYKTFV